MKKRGIAGRLAVLAIVLSLVTMSITSGTLAKYASSASGNATATVAKWAIKFTDGGTGTYTGTDSITLNLKDTQKVTDKLVADDRIAPGTTGSFAMAVDGSGTEVAFSYSIELNMSDTNLQKAPIKFYSNEACTDALTVTDNKITLTGEVKMDAASKSTTKDIYWKWDSTGIGSGTTEDERDTALGTAAATFTIPVTITAEQLTETPAPDPAP